MEQPTIDKTVVQGAQAFILPYKKQIDGMGELMRKIPLEIRESRHGIHLSHLGQFLTPVELVDFHTMDGMLQDVLHKARVEIVNGRGESEEVMRSFEIYQEIERRIGEAYYPKD